MPFYAYHFYSKRIIPFFRYVFYIITNEIHESSLKKTKIIRYSAHHFPTMVDKLKKKKKKRRNHSIHFFATSKPIIPLKKKKERRDLIFPARYSIHFPTWTMKSTSPPQKKKKKKEKRRKGEITRAIHHEIADLSLDSLVHPRLGRHPRAEKQR